MKETIFKIGLFLLIFSFTVQGCEKDEKLDSKILGKWQLLYSTGGIVGTSYPKEGHIYTLEFTDEGILIEKDNNVITYETEYSISVDKLTYSRGALLKYTVDISNDMLELSDITFSFYYKRIKH